MLSNQKKSNAARNVTTTKENKNNLDVAPSSIYIFVNLNCIQERKRQTAFRLTVRLICPPVVDCGLDKTCPCYLQTLATLALTANEHENVTDPTCDRELAWILNSEDSHWHHFIKRRSRYLAQHLPVMTFNSACPLNLFFCFLFFSLHRI